MSRVYESYKSYKTYKIYNLATQAGKDKKAGKVSYGIFPRWDYTTQPLSFRGRLRC